MTDRDESMIRTMYMVPECPAVETVWQRWRDMGESARIEDVREVCWGFPIELYTFRRLDLERLGAKAAERLKFLYALEEDLIRAWQDIAGHTIRIPQIETELARLIQLTQRKLADEVFSLIGGRQ